MTTSARTERATVFLEMADLSSDFIDRAVQAYLRQCKPGDRSVVESVVGVETVHGVRHTANSRVLADVSFQLLVQNFCVREGDELTGTVIGTFNEGVTLRAGDNVFAIVKFPADGAGKKRYVFRNGAWYAGQPLGDPESAAREDGGGDGLAGYERIAVVGTDYACRVTCVIVDNHVQKCFAEPV